MTFIIIEPTADDSESISEVLRTTWLATYPSAKTGISKRDIEGIDFQSPAAVAKRKKSITNTDANKHLWVAREDEKVVGICRVSKDTSCGCIQALYVLPTHQSKGIGTALLKKAMRWFGNKKVSVNVATYNKKAIGFYTKHGFVATGKVARSKAAILPSGKIIPEINLAFVRS